VTSAGEAVSFAALLEVCSKRFHIRKQKVVQIALEKESIYLGEAPPSVYDEHFSSGSSASASVSRPLQELKGPRALIQSCSSGVSTGRMKALSEAGIRLFQVTVSRDVYRRLERVESEPWKLVKKTNSEWLQGKSRKTVESYQRMLKFKHEKSKKLAELLEAPLIKRQEQEELIHVYRADTLPMYLVSRNGILPKVREMAMPFVDVEALALKSKGASEKDAIDLTHQHSGAVDQKTISVAPKGQGINEKVSLALFLAAEAKKLAKQRGTAQGRMKTHTYPFGRKERDKTLAMAKRMEADLQETKSSLSRIVRVFNIVKETVRHENMLRLRSENPKTALLKQSVQRELFQWFRTSPRYADRDDIGPTPLDMKKERITLEVLLIKTMRHLKARFRQLRDKVDDPQALAIDWTCQMSLDQHMAKWHITLDSLNVVRICKLLLTVEAEKLKKVCREFERSLRKLRDSCDELIDIDVTKPGLRQKLEEHVRQNRKKAEETAHQLKYMISKFKGGSVTNELVSESCPICKEQMMTPAITKCGHTFCFECVKSWITRKNRCPKCREKLKLHELTLVSNSKDDAKTKADEEEKSKKEAEECSHHHLPEEIRDISIKGQGEFGTKVETLVRYLMMIERQEPGAKVLVFSHFKRTLDFIAAALEKNEIPFVQLKGSAKLRGQDVEKFKKGSKLRVMLMSLRSDSSGLTLVAATHVFLAEPSFNVAIEQQAINRVHRIGQTKPCMVYRMVTLKSIEDAIFKAACDNFSSSSSSKAEVSSVESKKYSENKKSRALTRQSAKEKLSVKELLKFLNIDDSD